MLLLIQILFILYSVADIMNAFYDVRIRFYDKRKGYLMGKLREELEKLDNKVRFVQSVISGKLVISNKKKSDLLAELKAQGFKAFSAKISAANEEDEIADIEEGNYDYLLGMKLWSLTQEKVQQLITERNVKREELNILATKTAEDLWMHDLDCLEKALDDFEQNIEKDRLAELKAQEKARSGKGGTKSGAGKSKKTYESDEDDLIDDYESDYEDKRKKNAKKKVTKTASTAMQPTVFKGILIPRKVAAEPIPRVAKQQKPASGKVSQASSEAPDGVFEIEDDDDNDNGGPGLGLAARLGFRSGSVMTNGAASTAAIAAKPKTAPGPKKSSQPVKRKSKKLESDDEFDSVVSDQDEITNVPLLARIRQPREAAKKIVYAIDELEDDEEAEFEDENNISEFVNGMSDESFSEEDDDDEEDNYKPAAKTKKAPAPVKSAHLSTILSAISAPATKAAVAPKAAASTAKPKESKKAAVPKTSKEPKQTKAAVKKRAKAVSEDEFDEELNSADECVPPPAFTTRAPRAAAKKVVYALDSEDEDDDNFSEAMSDFIEEDDDDFDSDFGGNKKKPVKQPQQKAKAPAAASSSPVASKKRAVKKTTQYIDSEDDDDAYSPSTPSPSVVRKTKKVARK
jgi:DNA topoisomerase-2